MNRYTGFVQSANDLTWNYASVLTTLERRSGPLAKPAAIRSGLPVPSTNGTTSTLNRGGLPVKAPPPKTQPRDKSSGVMSGARPDWNASPRLVALARPPMRYDRSCPADGNQGFWASPYDPEARFFVARPLELDTTGFSPSRPSFPPVGSENSRGLLFVTAMNPMILAAAGQSGRPGLRHANRSLRTGFLRGEVCA